MPLQELYTKTLEKCLDSLKIYKALIQELKGELAQSEENYLKQFTMEYCDIGFDFQKSQEALKKTEDEYVSKNYSAQDIAHLYEENLQNSTKEFKYFTHNIWKYVSLGETDVEVHELTVTNPDKYEQLDESIFCANIFTPPIDPIIKTVIRNPFRNTKCSHVYEEKYIFAYIKRMKNKAKCPYMGCSNICLRERHLLEDNELKTKIMEYINQNPNSSDSD